MPRHEAEMIGEGAHPNFDHQVILETKPGALLFKEPVNEPVEILVCGACGAIAFFAGRPDRLWYYYQQRSAGQG